MTDGCIGSGDYDPHPHAFGLFKGTLSIPQKNPHVVVCVKTPDIRGIIHAHAHIAYRTGKPLRATKNPTWISAWRIRKHIFALAQQPE